MGHKGADHVAPGNTIESFEAALEHGVDMIEFDVLRTRDGRLVLAHDYEDSESRDCVTLEEGLAHFAGEAYAGVELDVDMKLPGYEREVAEGLARHGLLERSLVSTMYPESLDLLGELQPGLRAAGPCHACGGTTCAHRCTCACPCTPSPSTCAPACPGRRRRASGAAAARRSCATRSW